ncbi:MAG: hypothetical protein OXJ56_12980, partial [Rhodospirillaceae bacterium]|nr:hypothetical protein [Rhodospirillaceae bacterium]
MNLFQLHLLSGVLLLGQLAVATAGASTARTDWEIACNIRSDKFDYVLPDAMRDNGIDMWIVIDKGRGTEPLSRDFGDASSNGNGVFVFTDRGGDRIERSSIGRGIDQVRYSGVYDIV